MEESRHCSGKIRLKPDLVRWSGFIKHRCCEENPTAGPVSSESVLSVRSPGYIFVPLIKTNNALDCRSYQWM